MPDKTEVIHIRIEKKIMKVIRKFAKEENRSYQHQINYMLKNQIELEAQK